MPSDQTTDNSELPVLDGTSAEPSVEELGRRIRTKRKALGLSIERFCATTGLSMGLVSMVERGQTNPSFSTLVAIARGLGVSVAGLLEDRAQRSLVVRRTERSSGHRLGRSTSSAIQELLSPGTDGMMEALFLEFPPGAPASDLHQHQGEDFLYVISGELGAYVGDEYYRLATGDSIQFSGLERHTYENPGSAKAEVILVSTVPMHG